MELASSGRLIAAAGVSLGAIGFLFSNAVIVILAVLLYLYLLAEGISFRRAVNVFEDSVRLKTSPRNIGTVVGLRSQIETTVENRSHMHFRLVGFRRNFSPEIHQEMRETKLLLRLGGEQPVDTVLETTSPGRFETSDSTVRIEDLTRLFRQSVTLPDKLAITARPMIGKVNPLPSLSSLSDLAADPVRRGIGTDLAGIRPVSSLSDLHRIDWKATARAGKLMARDFYLERDPPIMLLIESSSLAVAERTTGSVRKSLIGELAGLLADSQLARSPIGLILYDDRTIITKIEAGLGLENRERILRALLQRTKHASATKPSAQQTSRPYSSLAGEADAIARQLASPGKTEPVRGPFASFADAVLPFYRKTMSGYLPRLRKEGVFKAFEVICDLTEPVLVIAISDGKTSWVGLCEGARYAAMLNHWVIVGILSWAEKDSASEPLPNFASRVRVVQCVPEGLWRAVGAEILAASRARLIRESS